MAPHGKEANTNVATGSEPGSSTENHGTEDDPGFIARPTEVAAEQDCATVEPRSGTEAVITPASLEPSTAVLPNDEMTTEEWIEMYGELYIRVLDEEMPGELARREEAKQAFIQSLNEEEKKAVDSMLCLSRGDIISEGKKKASSSSKKKSAKTEEKKCQLFSSPKAEEIVKILATEEETLSDLMKIHGVTSEDLATPEHNTRALVTEPAEAESEPAKHSLKYWFKAADKKGFCECKLCEEVIWPPNQSKHLKARHPEEFEEVRKESGGRAG